MLMWDEAGPRAIPAQQLPRIRRNYQSKAFTELALAHLVERPGVKESN